MLQHYFLVVGTLYKFTYFYFALCQNNLLVFTTILCLKIIHTDYFFLSPFCSFSWANFVSFKQEKIFIDLKLGSTYT